MTASFVSCNLTLRLREMIEMIEMIEIAPTQHQRIENEMALLRSQHQNNHNLKRNEKKKIILGYTDLSHTKFHYVVTMIEWKKIFGFRISDQHPPRCKSFEKSCDQN